MHVRVRTYIRAYVRTYVHACVRTCVVRTYAEVGHAVLPVLAAPCVPVVDASTCVPDVPVVPVPGVPDRTYVRMYVRTYVRLRSTPALPATLLPCNSTTYVRTYRLECRCMTAAPVSHARAHVPTCVHFSSQGDQPWKSCQTK